MDFRWMDLYHGKPPMAQSDLIFTVPKEKAFNFPQWKLRNKTLSRRFLVWEEIVKQGRGEGSPAPTLTLMFTSCNSHSSQTFLSCRTVACMWGLPGSRKGSWLCSRGRVSNGDSAVYQSCAQTAGTLLLLSSCLGVNADVSLPLFLSLSSCWSACAFVTSSLMTHSISSQKNNENE